MGATRMGLDLKRWRTWAAMLFFLGLVMGSSTDVTRRYARQTPDALGRRAAEALERSGLVAM
jgi:hypothetical protein